MKYQHHITEHALETDPSKKIHDSDDGKSSLGTECMQFTTEARAIEVIAFKVSLLYL